ncbi:hypothetical protein OE88DRAFT_1358379 [Heliocybe sulcata]|uniref:SH3 domain-containing protein n=1 Tax=Heliocybe sulcata TaxID=5364 RepID=A0A5C3NB65_9AGAM|nr:hypothetical protein OE88DRAFT_1358379 [Heliocybe sulcata]
MHGSFVPSISYLETGGLKRELGLTVSLRQCSYAARFMSMCYVFIADSPEDPQELSLRKDEVVLVLLARGTWWTVRNEDGAVGVVPSSSLLPVIGRASLHSLQAVACFDYVAASEDEISFCGGDILNVCNFQDEWWEVYKANGDTGMAPSNYLRLWWADKQSYFRGSAVAELSPREMPSANGEELSFAKDDILDIWDINDKWWMASNSDGKRGIVPLNYLAPLSSEAENIKVKAQYACMSCMKYQICYILTDVRGLRETDTAAQPDDVSLSTGEILEIIYFRNDGWWKVKKGDGTEGCS